MFAFFFLLMSMFIAFYFVNMACIKSVQHNFIQMIFLLKNNNTAFFPAL